MESRMRDTFQEIGCERKEHELKVDGGEDTVRDMLHSPNISVCTGVVLARAPASFGCHSALRAWLDLPAGSEPGPSVKHTFVFLVTG